MNGNVLEYVVEHIDENTISLHFKKRLSETLDGSFIFAETYFLVNDHCDENEVNEDGEIAVISDERDKSRYAYLQLIGQMAALVEGVEHPVDISDFQITLMKGVLFGWGNIITDVISNVLMVVNPNGEAVQKGVLKKQKNGNNKNVISGRNAKKIKLEYQKRPEQ